MFQPKQKLINFLESGGKISSIHAEEISRHFDEKDFERNDFFLKEGKVSNEYLVLEEGMMRSFATDTEGNEVTTAFWQPIQPVFEVASFFMRLPSQENIQAITPCKGWVIQFDTLNTLFHSMLQFREFGRGELVKAFASFKTRKLSIITQTAEERYAELVRSRPEILQHAALKHIASFLGITDSSLSRIRKEMMKK